MWDEEARFELREGPQNRLLKLSVLDETDTKPELIGDTVIQLKPAYDSNPVEGFDEWHELTYKGKYAGEVYLEMTFYPARPPSGSRRKKRSSQQYSMASSIYGASEFGASVMTTATSTTMLEYGGSQLGYSQSIMSSASTCRPLPEEPNGSPSRPSSASSGSAVPNRLPASHYGSQHPGVPSPPAHSVYGGRDGLLNMSTMSRTLPNPFDYQEFGDLPAIPPEHVMMSGTPDLERDEGEGVLYEEEEDPMAFFTTPLPPGPGDEDYENFQQQQQQQHGNTTPTSVTRHTSNQSIHMYSPTKSSPLSQSTSSDTLSFSEPDTPQHAYYYDDLDQQSSPVPPAHKRHTQPASSPVSQAGLGSDIESKQKSIRRKPISSPGLSNGATMSNNGSQSPTRPQLVGEDLPGSIPFSADSYVSQKSLTPAQRYRRRQSDRPSMYASHHTQRGGAGEDEFAETVTKKPLPRAPGAHAHQRPEHDEYSHNNNEPSINTRGLNGGPDYIGEGQWDLSDELNAGYSDDVYGGFMGGSGSSSPTLPEVPKRTRSRQERMSLPVDLSGKYQQRQQYHYRGGAGHEYLEGYYEEDNGIRYVN